MPFYFESYMVDDIVARTDDSVRPLNWRIWTNDVGAEYEAHMRLAFEFMRRNGDRRYSSKTLQTILQAADEAEQFRVHGIDRAESLPALITLTKPVSYDEETEVKSGGLAGAGVLFPSNEGRFVVAVAPAYRTNGLGRSLVDIAHHTGAPVAVYANQMNHGGQRFLLSCGMAPVSITSSGTVCYSRMLPDIEADDGTSERLRRARRGRGGENF